MLKVCEGTQFDILSLPASVRLCVVLLETVERKILTCVDPLQSTVCETLQGRDDF